MLAFIYLRPISANVYLEPRWNTGVPAIASHFAFRNTLMHASALAASLWYRVLCCFSRLFVRFVCQTSRHIGPAGMLLLFFHRRYFNNLHVATAPKTPVPLSETCPPDHFIDISFLYFFCFFYYYYWGRERCRLRCCGSRGVWRLPLIKFAGGQKRRGRGRHMSQARHETGSARWREK